MNENALDDLQEQLNTTDLFLHKLRPEWGPALMVLQEQTKRSYQFQDGQLRKLKDGWYHMMVPFQANETRAEMVREELEEQHEIVAVERAERKEIMAQEAVMSFADQLKIFAYLYPAGFQDPAYLDKWRKPSGKKRSKRHVDSSLAMAKERLSAKALDTLIEAEDYTGVMDSLLAVMAATSLAPPSRTITPMKAIDPTKHKSLAVALRALLHGDEPYKARYAEWLIALSDAQLKIDWTMATLPAALYRPNKHLLVKPKVLRLQARILNHGVGIRKRPTPRGYTRSRKIARATQEALVEAGLTPTDLLDVRAFIWETLRPKGQDILGDLGRRRTA